MKKLSDSEKRRLVGFKDDISNIQSDIADLEEKLRDLQAKKTREIKVFNDDIYSLQKDIKSKREDVKNIRDKITNIKKESIKMKKSEFIKIVHEMIGEELNTKKGFYESKEIDKMKELIRECIEELNEDSQNLNKIVKDVVNNFKKITGLDIKKLFLNLGKENEPAEFDDRLIKKTLPKIQKYVLKKYNRDIKKDEDFLYALDDELIRNL